MLHCIKMNINHFLLSVAIVKSMQCRYSALCHTGEVFYLYTLRSSPGTAITVMSTLWETTGTWRSSRGVRTATAPPFVCSRCRYQQSPVAASPKRTRLTGSIDCCRPAAHVKRETGRIVWCNILIHFADVMALQELSEKFGGTWKMESEENIAKYLEAMGKTQYDQPV